MRGVQKQTYTSLIAARMCVCRKGSCDPSTGTLFQRQDSLSSSPICCCIARICFKVKPTAHTSRS